MISFFLSHLPAFLTMAIAGLGALLFRVAAAAYAEKEP